MSESLLRYEKLAGELAGLISGGVLQPGVDVHAQAVRAIDAMATDADDRDPCLSGQDMRRCAAPRPHFLVVDPTIAEFEGVDPEGDGQFGGKGGRQGFEACFSGQGPVAVDVQAWTVEA